MTTTLFPYMGTKRYLAQTVQGCVDAIAGVGPVADLFAGSGAVATALIGSGRNVVANDTSAFICGLQRAQLLPLCEGSEGNLDGVIDTARARFDSKAGRLQERVVAESRALADGPESLKLFMDGLPGPRTSTARREKYGSCAEVGVPYDMVVDYFGSRYFSTEQAAWLDALREAIDSHFPAASEGPLNMWDKASLRDVALGAWVLAAHSLANTTGHGAQYLKPTLRGHARIAANWRRSTEQAYRRGVAVLRERRGKYALTGNVVTRRTAESFFGGAGISVAAAYADPPYTKDQYSRMYHLHETLFLYDAPEVEGVGIARTARLSSDFSVKSRALAAVASLVQGAKHAGCPLILSYPSNGLVALNLSEWHFFLASMSRVVEVLDIDVEYSTMGGRSGFRRKTARERLFVLR